METKTRKVVWLKPPGRRNINNAQDETWKGVTPVAGTGAHISQNSQVYSRNIETPLNPQSLKVKAGYS